MVTARSSRPALAPRFPLWDTGSCIALRLGGIGDRRQTHQTRTERFGGARGLELLALSVPRPDNQRSRARDVSDLWYRVRLGNGTVVG